LHFQVTIGWSIYYTSTNDKSQDAYMFTMFNKEKNKTELSIRLTKDEKGKGNNPQDRYDLLSSTIIILTLSFSGYCTFYKDLPGPLYQNNFLFSLSMLLTRIPFRNYKALNKLMNSFLKLKIYK